MPVENTQENFAKCNCEPCPSYNACMRGGTEKLYCAKEKSHCEVPMEGCTCMNCLVHEENKLDSGYYCIKGKV